MNVKEELKQIADRLETVAEKIHTESSSMPSKDTLKSALDEIRRLHIMADKAGEPPNKNYVAVAKWIKGLIDE